MARAQSVSWRTGSPRQCDLRKQTPSDRLPLDSCRIEAARSGGLAMNQGFSNPNRAMHLTQPPSIYCGSGQRRKGDRLHLHRLLSQSVEKLASGGRFAPVETEREFVQVIVQMVVANRSLVSPKQPPFEQREHPMRSGQEVFVLSVSLDLSVVDVALQLSIGVQPVGSDRAARFDRLGN